MLFPVAGSKLFIVGRASASEPWTEIQSAESFGSLGVEWSAVDVTDVTSPHSEIVKGIMSPRTMQIVLGNDMDDPGQLLLWRASRSRESFRFRLEFPGAASWREWWALVMSLEEAFDSANSVVKLLATLQLTSDILRPDIGERMMEIEE